MDQRRRLRQNYLANRVFDTCGAILEACCEASNAPVGLLDTIRSIATREWAKEVSPQGAWNVCATKPFNGPIEEVMQSHHFRSGEELETTLHRYVWLVLWIGAAPGVKGSHCPPHHLWWAVAAVGP